ncbi:hypothetical protein NV64_04055 [Erwinia sp. B116]|nr:hypothetical protein NV64_04055 [Erwinia sp. B116]
MIRQKTHELAGKDQKRDAFPVAGAGAAVKQLVQADGFGGHARAGRHRIQRLQLRVVRQGSAAEQRMRMAAVQRRSLGVQRLIVQPGERHGQRQRPHLDTPVQQPALNIGRGAHTQIDAYLRRPAAHLRQRVGNLHLRGGHQIIDQRDAELTAQLFMQLIDLLTEGFHRRQQRVAEPQDLPPLIGQRKTGTATLAQSHAETLFQIAHVQADRRAGDPQQAFCRRETAALCHCLKHTQ